MQASRNRVIALLLFATAAVVLIFSSLLEGGTINPESKGDSYAGMAIVGIFMLVLSIWFWGRSRNAPGADSSASQAGSRGAARQSIANLLLFFPYLLACLFCWLAAVAAAGTAEHSALGGIVQAAVVFGLLSGLVGLVAILLGKRKLALICFTIMVVPTIAAVILVPTLPTDSFDSANTF